MFHALKDLRIYDMLTVKAAAPRGGTALRQGGVVKIMMRRRRWRVYRVVQEEEEDVGVC